MVDSEHAKYNKYLYHNNKHGTQLPCQIQQVFIPQQHTWYVVSMPNKTSIYAITKNTVHSQLAKYNKYLQNKNKHGMQLACQIQQVFIPQQQKQYVVVACQIQQVFIP